MPITKFRIENTKALKLAACDAVPKIMVIAGPNGIGKSTLLYALKSARGVERSGRVLYLSPHRIWRRQNVQLTHLWGTEQLIGDILMSDSVNAFEGFRVLDATRGPNSADEAFGAIKYTLSQFETRKQSAVNRMLDVRGSVTTAEVGDVYAPIRKLLAFLLPHLAFGRIDLSTRTNVRVLFERTDDSGKLDVELDDLSSGERALISLFMPFLEAQILEVLRKIESDKAAKPKDPDLVVLIDEPEIHLHPFLQARLLEYLRTLSRDGGTQFILTTHSPTLLDAADYDELFILRGPAGTPPANQLTQLASTAEKLSALRALTGDTFNLTTGRSILFVEGEVPDGKKNSATDVRILELALPELASNVIIPFGGKTEVVKAAKRLKDQLPQAFGVDSVRALVDLDTDAAADAPDGLVHKLPVAMIENLLINPDALWAFLQPQRERVSLNGPDAVREEFKRIAAARRAREIELRVQRKLPSPRLQAKGTTLEEINRSLDEQLETIRADYPREDALRAIVADATSAVDAILAANDESRYFHGKEMLEAFYGAHVHALGVGYAAFCLQVARIIGANDTMRAELAGSFKTIVRASLRAAEQTLKAAPDPK